MFLKCKMDCLNYAVNWKFLKDKYALGLLVQQEFGSPYSSEAWVVRQLVKPYSQKNQICILSENQWQGSYLPMHMIIKVEEAVFFLEDS